MTTTNFSIKKDGQFDNTTTNFLSTSNMSSTTIHGDIIPSVHNTYNLGSDTKRFKDVYITDGTLFIGDVRVEATDGELATRRKVGGEWQAKKYPNKLRASSGLLRNAGLSIDRAVVADLTTAQTLTNKKIANTGLQFVDNQGTPNTITVKAPASATTQTLTLPGAVGASGTVLQTNGSGVLSWAVAGGGGPTLKLITNLNQFNQNSNTELRYDNETTDLRIILAVANDGDTKTIFLPTPNSGNIGIHVKFVLAVDLTNRRVRIRTPSGKMYGGGVLVGGTNATFKDFGSNGGTFLKLYTGKISKRGTVIDFYYSAVDTIICNINGLGNNGSTISFEP